MIKIRDLEYLTAIAEYKHFGHAADACFVSQPTLSGQIQKLEQQLKLTLIERQPRNVMLTPAGEKLVQQARQVLNAAKNFEEAAKSLLDPLSGDLHIGLIPTLAPYVLPHIMPTLNSQLARINFYLHENRTQDLLHQLVAGKLDILILPWLPEMASFERFDLFTEPLVMATSPSHELANKTKVTFDDLHNQKILTLEDGHCLRDQAMGYCFSAGAEEDHSFRATSLETLRYMVASNMGITLLPQLATINYVPQQHIHYIPFEHPQPVREIVLLCRVGYARMESVRAIVKEVRKAVDGLFN
ncbi:DNA-binding transcriptional regulator OxyR [Cognaticolwellia aestuarii]|uniref:DNA-binding transcriptional regulator OxyR n=1 Tax=Cognaticolwellia aestuarii TaxID=329993 RepID=UPI000987AD92|nr:DNA-binding transcriptional regulator OxyR [Cognaticolwellia aestuarii]